MNKNLKIAGLVVLVVLVGLLAWAPSQYDVPVLMYHSVAPSYHEPLNNVRPQNFSRQMDFLKNNGYNVISVPEFIEGLKAGRRFAFKTAVITFDDGLANNYTDAYPVLQKRGLRAALFVPSAEVGRKGNLTWDQIKDMASHGMTIGSHTRHEAYVPDADESKLTEELAQSKIELERQMDRPVEYLAYPVGGYTKRAKDVAQSLGYKAAFTTNRGESKKKDLFALRRIRIKDTDTDFLMLVKLSGYYNFFRSLRDPN